MSRPAGVTDHSEVYHHDDDKKASASVTHIEAQPDLSITFSGKGTLDEGIHIPGVRQDLLVDLPESLVHLTPEEIETLDKGITRKLDWIILPCLGALYILNYLDRQNIASAKLDTLMKDLNLTQVQYSTCISVLFAGYIALQVSGKYPEAFPSLLSFPLITGNIELTYVSFPLLFSSPYSLVPSCCRFPRT